MSATKWKPYPKYKETDFEWIPKIPENWNIVPLRYLCKVKTGEKDLIDQNPEGKYPFFVRSPEVRRISTYSYDGEGILTAGDGNIGEIFHYINGKFDYHQRVYLFYNFNGVFPKFLYYFLKANLREVVLAMSAKSTVESIRLPMLTSFPIALPSLEEEQLISEIIQAKECKINLLIENLNRQLELLEAKRSALMIQAVTKGLNPDVMMKDSGLDWVGEVPEHWDMKKVKHLFQLTNEPSATSHGMELLSIYTAIGVRPRKSLEQKGNKATSIDGYWIVKKEDLIVNKLLAWMGAIGRSEYDGVTSPAYDILRPLSNTISEYYHFLFRCGICLPEFKKRSRGIMDMRLRLYFEELGSIEVPCPPPEEQQEIADYIRGLDDKQIKLESTIKRQIELFHEYRVALISAAVTGKINVRGQ